MDLEIVRNRLSERRGQWSRLAAAAGINRKTIERLMSDDGYNPTLATLRAIVEALDAADGAPPVPAESKEVA